MSFLVFFLAGICVFLIVSVTFFADGKEEGLSSTAIPEIEGTETNSAVFKKEREQEVKGYLSSMMCLGYAGLVVWVLVSVGVPLKNALYCTPPLILAGIFPLIYYTLCGED
jgi:hypothetical protein